MFDSFSAGLVILAPCALALLAIAPIGIAIGVERYVLAVGATVLVLCVLDGVEKRFIPAPTEDR